jgi:ATP-dependent protease HslVU (ClpYQ) peptidase subunit
MVATTTLKIRQGGTVMINYDKFITQAQENMQQAARQLTETQEKAIAAFKEAQGNASSGLPSATQLVEANYRFANQVLQTQKDLTLRWLEAFAPAAEPNKAGRTGRVASTPTAE